MADKDNDKAKDETYSFGSSWHFIVWFNSSSQGSNYHNSIQDKESRTTMTHYHEDQYMYQLYSKGL